MKRILGYYLVITLCYLFVQNVVMIDMYDTDGYNHDEENEEDYGDNNNNEEYAEEEFQEEYSPLKETDRIIEYEKRGYQWPIPDESFIPNTTGFIQKMRYRIDQVNQLTNHYDRYDGYRNIVTTSFLVHNYTQYGFGMTRCLDDNLMNELRNAIYEGIDTAELETEEPAIVGPNPPLMITTRDDLTQRVLHELHPYAEEWAGIELEPYGAYGFRIYRNESQLYMHVDSTQTHIISFILNIASSDDAKPWPLFIEDYHGNTHEVVLTSGDILFYESAKLLHGRPKQFNGSWYTSVFVHYYPKYSTNGWSYDKDMSREADYAVPPIWVDSPPPNNPNSLLPKLALVDSAMMELNCPNDWCDSMNTIQWGGPSEKNILLTPNQQKQPFYPKLINNEEL